MLVDFEEEVCGCVYKKDAFIGGEYGGEWGFSRECGKSFGLLFCYGF